MEGKLVLDEPPYSNDKAMLLYIWTIVGKQKSIDIGDLFFIIFDTQIYQSSEAKDFIGKMVEKGYLKAKNSNLVLRDDLFRELEKWQKNRRKAITEAMLEARKQRHERLKEEIVKRKERTAFAVLFSQFADERTLQRALAVSRRSIDILKDGNKFFGKIYGSKEYNFIIDPDNRVVSHDCPDYTGRRMPIKTFCKHLVRMFVILMRSYPEETKKILVNMGLNLQDWFFTESGGGFD